MSEWGIALAAAAAATATPPFKSIIGIALPLVLFGCSAVALVPFFNDPQEFPFTLL